MEPSQAEYPHCNTEVLHAPGTCQFCDLYPDRQATRAASGTPFTPAEANGWYGNVAQPGTRERAETLIVEEAIPVGVELNGVARLWDKDFNHLATQLYVAAPKSADRIQIAVKGKGPLYHAVKAALNNSLDLHLTFDHSVLFDWKSRIGGIVTKLEIEERQCECGNDIVTTTIHARPAVHNPRSGGMG